MNFSKKHHPKTIKIKILTKIAPSPTKKTVWKNKKRNGLHEQKILL